MRRRTSSSTKSRMKAMSSPAGLPASAATLKYMNEFWENDAATTSGSLTSSG